MTFASISTSLPSQPFSLPVSVSAAGLLNVAPPSQKAPLRPIAFVLDDPVTNTISSLSLNIRPEELTRGETSRTTVNQTLGDSTPAWVDSFGPGLPTINISGHTGWRGSNGMDGMALFQALNKICYSDFHEKRKIAIQRGIDPNGVKLVFVDSLDSFSWIVIPLPNSFTLRRSRTRPLLMQYQISLQAIDTNVDNVTKAIGAAGASTSVLSTLGLQSLAQSLSTITDGANEIASFINGSLGTASAAFLQATSGVLNVVNSVAGTVMGAVDTVASSLLSTARNFMMAGRNLMAAVTLVSNLPTYAEYRMQQIMGAFSNAICLLSNVFTPQLSMPNYSDIYGSSNCSSTSGGSPISPLLGQNPFALINASAATPAGSIAVSSDAANAMQTYAYLDPVSQSASAAQLQKNMTAITSGVNTTWQAPAVAAAQ